MRNDLIKFSHQSNEGRFTFPAQHAEEQNLLSGALSRVRIVARTTKGASFATQKESDEESDRSAGNAEDQSFD